MKTETKLSKEYGVIQVHKFPFESSKAAESKCQTFIESKRAIPSHIQTFLAHMRFLSHSK